MQFKMQMQKDAAYLNRIKVCLSAFFLQTIKPEQIKPPLLYVTSGRVLLEVVKEMSFQVDC